MDPNSTSCALAPREERNFTRSEAWRRLAEYNPYPLAAALELTHRCNLACPHCYVVRDPSISELSTAEIVDVIDQMAKMGVLILTLTGGEPTVRDDFAEILKSALDQRFVVVLKTNATRLTRTDVRAMAEHGLYELNVSLYYTNAEQHDNFVRYEGAWQRAVDAMRLFKELGRNVRASIVVMDWNVAEAAAMERMCEDEGWIYALDFRIEPRNNGEQNPSRYRACSEALVELICHSSLLNGSLGLQRSRLPSLDAAMCGLEKGLIVQPNGVVVPCVGLATFRLGNIREKRLADIWRDSEERRKAIPLRWGDSPLCASCDLISDCHRCPATGFIEHGNFTTPSAYDCELAKVWREARLRLQKDEK